jgi:predicted signal transduction protein with EAL and GGDEF domain
MAAVIHEKVSGDYPVLCVDDEPQILEALALTLGQRFYVNMAASAEAALARLYEIPHTAVIISDMRMPRMNGAEFLAASRKIAPHARRLLITGHCDVPTAVAAVNEGQIFRFLTKPCASADLIAAVQDAIDDIEARKIEQSAIRRRTERSVLDRDPHTGLASRERLLDQISQLQSNAPDDGTPSGALLVGQIENMGAIVYESTLSGAESVMWALARRLQGHFTSSNCLAAYNEEKFAVLVGCEANTPESLELLGMGMVDVLSEPLEVDGVALPVNVSVGVVALGHCTDDARLVLKQAELAVDEARRRGKNMTSVFTEKSRARTEYRRDLLRALRVAIDKEELSLQYHPIVDVQNNSIHSIEALARWQHVQFGNVSPGSFIPLAEEADLMVPLGGWVLRRACQEVRGLLGPLCPLVNINVSVSQLLDIGFVDCVRYAMDKGELATEAVEIELTESVFAEDIGRVSRILDNLRRLGIRIAIDDFGVGYSSLSYVNHLPINTIKTDASFIRNFAKGGDAIIAAALNIAKKLGIEVVVEGVETVDMLESVRRLGAAKCQGFLFAKPMPATGLSGWIAEFATRERFAALG